MAIVMALLPSAMSDHMENAVLCATAMGALVPILGSIVAMNIALKKLEGKKHADPEEML
jgi:hypothetical protein